ncbi:MAG: T9SS type A sorting domain-containing protein [Ignavibacteriae bacterium]|nr:T9SS type A sorting domain-containing protein [Ignavibacteriota bacterium]
MLKILQYIFLAILFFVAFSIFTGEKINTEKNSVQRLRSTSSPKSGIKAKKGREEYFSLILRDPASNKIPYNIRQRELKFAKELEIKNRSLSKNNNFNELSWKEAGPNDVGGRTRALAIDVANSNTIIAGGVSGGIWKSTNNGSSWSLKSSSSDILSVTSIAQDTRSGKTNTWYYSSGEFNGSGQDLGYKSFFTGGGIYKSTDNGETWNLLPNAKDTNPLQWNTPYDYVSKIIVSPITGSVFIASHAFGLLRSKDGGSSFAISLGGTNNHIYTDVDVAANGTLVAVISSPFQGITPDNAPGVYKSTDDGDTWTNITPTTFPETHLRSVLALAPSNANTCYVMTFTGNLINEKVDDVRFHKINVSTGVSEDRSANMPNFENDFEDFIHTQNNYNMVVAVKPDNENFVLIGGTSLFRSTDGFATKPDDVKLDWIGGYHLFHFQYPNFHSDIHAFAFNPTNPKVMWWGHDGGLSYTSDITQTNYADVFPWENKNNGYNVTQFYMITQPNEAGDNRIMGGTQDNGSPFFTFNGTSTSESNDVSSGDGSYGYFANDFCYTSAQNGAVLRVNYDGNEKPSRSNGWSNITPQNAQNQSFINPYSVDPNDENTMFYPAGSSLWRNNQLSTLPVNQTFSEGITEGWNELTNLSVDEGYIISAMAVSESNPLHRLYYAASNISQTPQAPKIYRLDNANNSTSGAVELSISGASENSYIHNIAINPDNANEILITMSNYNIVGIFHSTDGGQNFTAVEGNLTGDPNNPGPSIRSGSILPTSNGNLFLVATSTGIYSTNSLNGNSTNWIIEGANTIGNVIVNYLSARRSDGRIVAGTHGRGAFIANAEVGGAAVASVNVGNLTLQSRPGETGSSSFILSNTGEAVLNYSISVSGSFNGNFGKHNKNVFHLEKGNLKNKLTDRFDRNFKNSKPTNSNVKSIKNPNSSLEKSNTILGNDYLYLDDGNENSDSFIGFGDDGFGGSAKFTWLNLFTLSGYNFEMDSFEFYMRTEGVSSNNVYLEIRDDDFNILDFGELDLTLSSSGGWYTVSLDPAISFSDGESFYILISSDNDIFYPAGADYDGVEPGSGFYYNEGNSTWVNINTISGFENGAFLIRPFGTLGENSNTDLVTVNPESGSIQPNSSETITLTLNAQNLNEGSYTGQVNISTNGGNFTIPIDYLVDVKQVAQIPTEFNLGQNYPNPFNPSTQIEFSLPQKSNVSLKIFDALGKEIANLINETKSAGKYQVSFNAINLSSGIYFYRLETDQFSETKKMLLIK